VQELKKAISLMPGEARPWFDLGRVLHRNRDDAAAESALEWAVRLAPSEPRFRQELDALRKVADKPVAGAIHAHFAPPADTAAEHAVLAASLAAAGDPFDNETKVGIAVSKDNPLLFAALQKAMAAVVADGDYAKLLATWKMPPSSAAY